MELLEDIDVYPFTRVIYNSKKESDEWAPKIRRAGSLYNTSEFEMVSMGYRKAGTMHISPQTYDIEIEKIIRNKMAWLPIIRTKNYEGFSHKHFPTNRNDMNSSVYGVMSKDIKTAEQFKEASNKRPVDHDSIGELLGFPKCCIDFFNKEWRKGFIDPIWQAAKRTKNVEFRSKNHVVLKKIYPEAVQVFRYIGIRITSHLTCSFDCEKTKEVGAKWLECQRKIDPEAAENLLEILSLPFKWSVKWGIAIVQTPHFKIITNSVPSRCKYIVEFKGK